VTRALVLACAVLALAAPAAVASSTQESIFQDDNRLLYSPPAEVDRTLDILRSLGVDRLRLTILWKAVAPDAGSRTRPPFDATNPDAYPPGAWDRYDHVVTAARARGIDVLFNPTGPGPLWANKPAPRDDVADSYEPDPKQFGEFVAAIGKRYPEVTHWSIWNEPNHSGWLTPQWAQDADGVFFARAASLYRELLGEAWDALQATGHGGQTILIGETAPKGDRSKGIKRYVEALTFVRALYCVGEDLRPLRGPAAGRLGCPGDATSFRAANPALFDFAGFAHHPYELLFAPSHVPRDRPNWVTLSSRSRLTRTLDRVFARHGVKRRLPLWMTEYGYQTNPPQALAPSFSKQAAWLNEAEYMSYRDPRVRGLAQFLLLDDGEPIAVTFQSGLMTIDGKPKPAYAAYRLPIFIPRGTRGPTLRVWGMLRPNTPGTTATAALQYRRAGSSTWRTIRTVRTASSRGYLNVRIRRPARKGHLRWRFRPPGARREVSSRAAFVHGRR
jgi:hypothetical protein